MRTIISMIAAVLLLTACGQSYEDTKRLSRQQRREAQQRDSAALKIAILPTLDGLPLLVARQEQLLDTIHGGVILKMYHAQMDCDTAVARGRCEGLVTDLVRVGRLEQQGTPMRCLTTTNAYWQLVTGRQSRIKSTRQMTDKMVGMARYSVTDLLSDLVRDSAAIAKEHLFKIQVNDIGIRMQMLMTGEIDALWLTEPWATMARVYKHPLTYDSRRTGMRPGVLAFREAEVSRPAREKQLRLLAEAWNKACDLINQRGVKHYRDLIVKTYRIKPQVVDSLSQDIRFEHCTPPSDRDVERAKKWLEDNKSWQ